MSGKRLHIVFGLLMVILMSSCSITHFVPDGKYLVKKNAVVVEDEDEHDKIEKSKLSSFITLKPYRETFQTNIPTWVYYKWEGHQKSKFWIWMNKTFGKEPVYYDPAGARNSARQMMRHLDNIGYFNSKVTHSVDLNENRKRATVTYNVYPSQPYYVSKFDYVIDDTLAKRYIMRDSINFQLKEGDIYDAYALSEQRDLITERLKNSGYFYFNRDNIYYEVDSNFMNHTMEITMRLKTTPLTFKKYYIRDIHIYPDFTVFRMNSRPVDSAQLTVQAGARKRLNTWDFHYFDKPQVKPQTFSRSIHIIEGLPYNLRSVTNTYKALANYRLFRNVNIEFDSVSSPDDSRNLLDCRITMQQNDVHSFTVQAEGTNSEGDLGIKGGLSYTNKNIFHGAETFQLSIKGGLEAQTIIGENTEVKQTFNTKELGLTASLNFPKFFSPFAFTNFAREYQPTTSVALGVNAQVRYYYSRFISTASFSYDWKSNTRSSHYFAPINLNGVKIANINSEFQHYLDQEISQRKKDQYTSHLILGLRYSYTYNTQSLRKTGSFIYLRADLETSGNLLSLFNNTKLMTTNGDHHEIMGIRYAQYVRTSADFRQHLDLGKQNWLVFRQFVGIGVPYGNSQDLPFERSFYGGGANGLRGWLYRTVGPGGYHSEEDKTEKTGDIQLEFNAEYRFPIYNIFNGALFIDAGNVWTYHPNESMSDAEFKFNSFYKQVAVDAGVGLRMDVSFLILRFDLAYAMRNPYKNEDGSYWRINDGILGHFNNLKFQVGIGYPF
jgi:outer membrane protein assembly factor BamA